MTLYKICYLGCIGLFENRGESSILCFFFFSALHQWFPSGSQRPLPPPLFPGGVGEGGRSVTKTECPFFKINFHCDIFNMRCFDESCVELRTFHVFLVRVALQPRWQTNMTPSYSRAVVRRTQKDDRKVVYFTETWGSFDNENFTNFVPYYYFFFFGSVTFTH